MVQIHQLFTESEKIKVVYKCERRESETDLILGHVWLKPHKSQSLYEFTLEDCNRWIRGSQTSTKFSLQIKDVHQNDGL